MIGARRGTGAAFGSPLSGPAITSNNNARSSTVRAIGPTTPSSANGPTDAGKCPVAGTRPGVGFRPQMPLKCAGTRIDPPPSLPMPPAEQPAAIAAASPPLEPPGVRARSHGLFVRPYNALSVSHAIRNSGTVVLPRTIAPADFSRDTNGASISATCPCRNRVPASQRRPATSIELFMVMGTPCSGPRAAFAATA